MLQQVSRSNGYDQHSLNGHASAKLVSNRLKSAPADEALPFRQAPHNLEAEQALLGAILVNNEAMDRVSGFLEPHHFFDPLHQQIFETAGKLIHAGKNATPITLRTFFERAEPISPNLTVPQYLGTLAANATTIINAEDYGRTILDLATRRSIIIACEDAISTAYDSPVDAPPAEQLVELGSRIETLSGECGREAMFAARCLADVPPEPIRWLWEERIARGKINLFGGMPGLGKSQLSCAFAAAVTTGGVWPDGTRAPLGSVIIIGCEDDAGDTIRPRLEAAGADLNKVHLFDWALVSGKKGKSERRHFDVREHGAALAELIAQIGDVVLIIIDPITAHLGRTDSHVTAEVRAALAPLQTLAAERLAAVILISHLNKGGSGDGSAMNRVTGSGAFIAVCRSAIPMTLKSVAASSLQSKTTWEMTRPALPTQSKASFSRMGLVPRGSCSTQFACKCPQMNCCNRYAHGRGSKGRARGGLRIPAYVFER